MYFDKRSGKWNAYINFKKKRYNLGYFRDIEDAVKERRLAEERLHVREGARMPYGVVCYISSISEGAGKG